jgi:putative transposase
MDSRYAKNAGAIVSLKYHVVWCSKYRRPVFVEDVQRRLRGLIAEKSRELGMTIHAPDVRPDHLHLVVQGDPTRCLAEIVNRFKGYSSRILRQEFPALRSRIPTLWSRSYSAGTVVHVSAATIQRYSASQKGK